jgi:hypothetical protein
MAAVLAAGPACFAWAAPEAEAPKPTARTDANAPKAEASAPTAKPAFLGVAKPRVVPQTWQFEFESDPLAPIEVQIGLEKKPRLYWYLRYTVTNRGDSDQVFVPELILYTDTGQVLRAGQQTPSDVFNALQKLYRDPMMKRQTAVTRKLLSGDDNAHSSVAMWPDFDPNAGTVDIFIGGLSGEVLSVPLPTPVTMTETNWKGEKQTVTRTKALLSKTLHLRFEVPGEAGARARVKPNLVLKEWVLR